MNGSHRNIERGRRWAPFFVCLALSVTVIAQAGGERRLAPPAAIDCDRNLLTSYEGRVASVSANPREWTVTLTTDWGSDETFKVATSRVQLVNGEPLESGQRPAFVDDNGLPEVDLRVIAWVCEDPATVTLDWRPSPD